VCLFQSSLAHNRERRLTEDDDSPTEDLGLTTDDSELTTEDS